MPTIEDERVFLKKKCVSKKDVPDNQEEWKPKIDTLIGQPLALEILNHEFDAWNSFIRGYI